MTTTTTPGKVLLTALSVSGVLMSVAAHADETLPFVEEHKGSLRFRATLPLPPARGHYRPEVTFTSTGPTSLHFIPAPKIVYYSDPYPGPAGLGFTFHKQDAEAVRLTGASRDGTGHYAFAVEDEYLDLVPTRNSAGHTVAWDAWDAKGSHYRFEEEGSDEYTLRRVTDTNGNRTEYVYSWINGPKLTSIRYNFYDEANPSSTSAVPASATSFATAIEWTTTRTRGSSGCA